LPPLTRSTGMPPPPWGEKYVDAAFAGDPEAAASLALALNASVRASMALFMYRGRVAPPAFREMLREALDQTHYYGAALRLARGRNGLARWLKYAASKIPTDLPETVTVYRGVTGCGLPEAATGTCCAAHPKFPPRFLQRVCHMRQKCQNQAMPIDLRGQKTGRGRGLE
jgi:hypothetical protein